MAGGSNEACYDAYRNTLARQMALALPVAMEIGMRQALTTMVVPSAGGTRRSERN